MRNSGAGNPVLDAERLAIEGEHAIARMVAVLLGFSGPLAVFGRVPKVIVDALKGVFSGRSGSHIRKELLEVVEPLRIYRNTTRTVTRELVIFGIRASLFHAVPRSVFKGVFPVSGSTVSANASRLVVKASAASGSAAFKRVSENPFLSPALANTEPIHSAATALFGFRGNGKSTEGFAA